MLFIRASGGKEEQHTEAGNREGGSGAMKEGIALRQREERKHRRRTESESWEEAS